MFYARNGGAAAVAPYAADATNKAQWEQGQRKHQANMSELSKSLAAVKGEQVEPATFIDTSLRSGRERSKAFIEHIRHQHVGQENKKLMGALHEIAKKPCITLKRIESEPGKLPPVSCGPNKIAARKRYQSSIEKENEAIAKRLLAVRTTFNRKKDEKEYTRHNRAVQDMAKVPPPGGFIRRKKVALMNHLQPLAPVKEGDCEDEEGTFIPASSGSMAAASRPFASRSMPSLMSQHVAHKEALASSTQGSRKIVLDKVVKTKPVDAKRTVSSEQKPAVAASLAPAKNGTDTNESIQTSQPATGTSAAVDESLEAYIEYRKREDACHAAREYVNMLHKICSPADIGTSSSSDRELMETTTSVISSQASKSPEPMQDLESADALRGDSGVQEQKLEEEVDEDEFEASTEQPAKDSPRKEGLPSELQQGASADDIAASTEASKPAWTAGGSPRTTARSTVRVQSPAGSIPDNDAAADADASTNDVSQDLQDFEESSSPKRRPSTFSIATVQTVQTVQTMQMSSTNDTFFQTDAVAHDVTATALRLDAIAAEPAEKAD